MLVGLGCHPVLALEFIIGFGDFIAISNIFSDCTNQSVNANKYLCVVLAFI